MYIYLFARGLEKRQRKRKKNRFSQLTSQKMRKGKLKQEKGPVLMGVVVVLDGGFPSSYYTVLACCFSPLHFTNTSTHKHILRFFIATQDVVTPTVALKY